MNVILKMMSLMKRNAPRQMPPRGRKRLKTKSQTMKLKKIFRSCGQHTPHLWPNSFPAYSSELYCDDDGGSAYSNLDGEKTLIADNIIADGIGSLWTYHTERKIPAVGLESGAVAMCKFITK